MLDAIKQKISELLPKQTLLSGEFYRKAEIKSVLKAVSDDATAHPKKYVGFAMIGFIAFYGIFGDFGIISRFRMEHSYKTLQKELQAETEQTQILQKQIERAKHLDVVEKLAREKYGFSKKGETVYVIK